jgi:hypothetical protein
VPREVCSLRGLLCQLHHADVHWQAAKVARATPVPFYLDAPVRFDDGALFVGIVAAQASAYLPVPGLCLRRASVLGHVSILTEAGAVSIGQNK